jgi:hypothetical protein
MTKCPFCHFENEDGAAFCEQCKSDLSVHMPEPVAAQPVEIKPQPLPAFTNAVPHADLPRAQPVVVEAYPIPVAVAEPMPVAAEVVPVAPPVLAPAIVELPEPPPSPPPAVHIAPPAVLAPAPAVAPAPVPVPVPVPVPASPTAPAAAAALPQGAQPRLLVLRGQKRNVEYPLYDGLNFVGRADDKPVDIDLEDQEPPDRVWCSRQHCCVTFESGKLEVEDLNSANGTYVNRQRIYPGQKRELHVNDIIQIGNVQLRVIV